MEHLIQLDTPAEFEHYKDVAGAPALDREKIKADAPDVTLLLVGPGSRLRGRCSLWWSDVPRVPGEHLGLIGHFAASNREATRKILTHAVDRLRAEHCSQVEVAALHREEIHRGALLNVRGKRWLVLEPKEKNAPFPLKAVEEDLDWADIEMFQILSRIPVDKRHNVKIDYPSLKKILQT